MAGWTAATRRERVHRVFSALLALIVIGATLPPFTGAAAVPAQREAAEPPDKPLAAPEPVADREVIRRTAFSLTERAPDGSYTTTLSPRPLHWREPSTGAYRPFDDALRPVPGASA